MIGRALRSLGSPAVLRAVASLALLALIAFGAWLILSGEAARVGLVGMVTLLFSLLAALRGHEELMEYEAEAAEGLAQQRRRERRRR